LARKSRGAAAGTFIVSVLLLLAQMQAGADEASARPTNPYAGNSEVIPEGNSLFNQYCSHCHGPNAVQGERPRDLRRLQIRYHDDAIVVFYATINNGRMDKGMPVWKGVLSEDVMWKIFTFLSSVQTEP
jgi:polar amino acid transport system substrate-binding protein